MGILQKPIEIRQRRGTPTRETLESDDNAKEIQKEVWDFLCPKRISKITIEELTLAIKEAYPDVDVVALWEELKPEKGYSQNSKEKFEALLKDILSNLAKYTIVKVTVHKPLGKFRPGAGVKGEFNERGSIGGFLINNDTEIFLFSDAHVLRRMINTALDNSTPAEQLSDAIRRGHCQIGVVVCSSQIQLCGRINYDMALAKIEPEYYRFILLEYGGNRAKAGAKSFRVTQVDDNLVDGKKVFLFGRTSGCVEGELLTSVPAAISPAPYHEFIGADKKEDVTLHGCIKIKSVSEAKAIQGDSGGLWVNEGGEAVAIQVMVEDDIAWAHPMWLVMSYFQKHYDRSLRFLTENELARCLLQRKLL